VTLSNILPPNSKGVIVVFENTCDQVFTYRIDGENAIYVGRGDQHDSKYDSLGVSSLTELRNSSDSSRGIPGLPPSQDFCQMTLRVYPSMLWRMYVTSDPVIFTVAVLILFSLHGLPPLRSAGGTSSEEGHVDCGAVFSYRFVALPSQVRDRLFQ
jgi:hypothetical protein